jgi:8-oxo-dGTP pyrophosphatase MutT (NUDIX family)
MSDPEARICEVAELDLAYEPAPWAFATREAERIDAFWAARKAALPKLFNGRVLLCGRHEFARRDDGATILRGAYFPVEYKAFLAWRDFGFPDKEVCNCFSMAALQSSDGAFLLGEMAAHTANGGVVYFAAGTPDPSDIIEGKVDLGASVRRELLEETGISPDEVAIAPDWIIVTAPARVACMKIMRMDETAERIKARVEGFLAEDAHAELARMHIVRDISEIDALNSPRFVADFLRHALGGG